AYFVRIRPAARWGVTLPVRYPDVARVRRSGLADWRRRARLELARCGYPCATPTPGKAAIAIETDGGSLVATQHQSPAPKVRYRQIQPDELSAARVCASDRGLASRGIEEIASALKRLALEDPFTVGTAARLPV